VACAAARVREEAVRLTLHTRPPEPSAVSCRAQAKDLLKRYGSAYLITSISFAVVSFAACYALVSSGAGFVWGPPAHP